MTSSFSKSSVFKTVFCPQKHQADVYIFLLFEERFGKYRFRDGLVWKVGLTVEIKLRHQISPMLCGRGVGVLMLLFAGDK